MHARVLRGANLSVNGVSVTERRGDRVFGLSAGRGDQRMTIAGCVAHEEWARDAREVLCQISGCDVG